MAYSTLHPALLLPIPPIKTLISKNSNILGFQRIPNLSTFGVRTGNANLRTSISASSTEGDLQPAIDDNPEGILTGEWPENISFLSYEDLRAYLESQVISPKVTPTAAVGEVMSAPVMVVRAEQTLAEIDKGFEKVSGFPVVDAERSCIGVVSKKDKKRARNGLKSKVKEVMSSPPITLSLEKTVMDAAALMLKKKIHRIPVVNEEGKVTGIVTRTDIFQALEAEV